MGVGRGVINEARVISVIVALSAFVVAVTAGLASDNPAWLILGRAVVAMFVGQLLGHGAGHVLAFVRRSHADHYIRQHPIPVVKTPGDTPAVVDGEQTVENSVAA